MAQMVQYDLVLQAGSAILPTATGLRMETVSIGVQNGKIAAISPHRLSGAEVVDCQHLTVLPGVIDSQVHFREPGMTHKEDLESGTRAAALGGVTSIFEMPNTIPSTTTRELFMEKLERAKGRCYVNYAFFVGATPDNAKELPELEALPHCSGVKIFMGSSTGSLLVEDDLALENILRSGKRRVIVHSEDEVRLRERKHLAVHVQDHPHWRDVETAVKSTTRLLGLARKTGRPVHVLHVSTAEELDLLRNHRDIATVEALPNHLTLHAPDCYERLGTRAQQNPPIREARHRDALWKALQDGVIDIIGSDHAPHTLEEKAQAYPKSPSGTPGVQTLVPIMLNHVNEGRLTLLRFCELVCENPRRIFGAQAKGRIAVGMDADFTIVDLKREETISNRWIASKSAWTPFDGMKVTGWPLSTIVRGKFAMRDGALHGPFGEPVNFS